MPRFAGLPQDRRCIGDVSSAGVLKPPEMFVRSFYELAESRDQAGRHVEALALYMAVSKAAKTERQRLEWSQRAYFNGGMIQRWLQIYDQAIGAFQEAVAIYPKDYHAWYYIAECHFATGDVEAMMRILEAGHTAAPVPFTPWSTSGRLERRAGGDTTPLWTRPDVAAESVRRCLLAINYSCTIPRREVSARHERWGKDVRAMLGPVEPCPRMTSTGEGTRLPRPPAAPSTPYLMHCTPAAHIPVRRA